MSHLLGLNLIKNVAPYAAVKQSVTGLIKTTVIDYTTQNIRVNVICHGPTSN